MKFFEAIDFENLYPKYTAIEWTKVYADLADLANAKIEREGKVVYGCIPPGEDTFCWDETKRISQDTHKALLINIEHIEKCTHPEEKVRKVIQHLIHGMATGRKTYNQWDADYQCECGAKLKPKTFEEINE